MRPLSGLTLSAVALALITPAFAAPPAIPPAQVGMVNEPCSPALPARPASVDAAIATMYSPTYNGVRPVIPPADQETLNAITAEQQKRDWPNLCKYHADNVRLSAAPAAERRVVFMGDSITEGWGVADPGFFKGGWINRGISGQTTPQMLIRFQADVVALHPKVVHILAATNDIAGNTGPTSQQTARDNIIAMATLAKANGIKVILGSVPPAKTFTWAPTLTPAPNVTAMNAWMKAYAAKNGFLYADYYALLAQPDGALKPALTFDGVHPNRAGYALIEPLTKKLIAQALK